jgi:DNA repair protein RecO (recombination protein O)
MKLSLEPAWVLHTRPYLNTSLLVEFFCLEGRITAVAKGAQRPRSPFRGSIAAFSPLLMSATGRGELLTLTHIELLQPSLALQGQNLFSGLYLNELLVKLAAPRDPHPQLYHYYYQALTGLAENPHSPAASLRLFEKRLIAELGYGLQWNDTSGAPLLPNQHYYYHLGVGFVRCPTSNELSFKGEHLLALAQEKLDTADVLATAKQLLRPILSALLGNRVIKSRELFQGCPFLY